MKPNIMAARGAVYHTSMICGVAGHEGWGGVGRDGIAARDWPVPAGSFALREAEIEI